MIAETSKQMTKEQRRCPGHSRHWWTRYGEVGVMRSNCGHCKAIHPVVLKALLAGMSYVRLYSPPEDAPDYKKRISEINRDVELLEDAIARVSNERQA